MEVINRIAGEHDEGKRLDVYLREETELSRARLASLIREGALHINGRVEDKPSYLLRAGDDLSLALPDVAPAAVMAQDIPLTILWEDEDIAVVDKPSGMVVHPSAGNEAGTLVNALLYHLHGLSGIGGEMRPGIVHRLDKDTSGLLVIAKNDRAHLSLSDQFRERSTEKHYAAVVQGAMRTEGGRIDQPIGRHPVDRKKMAIRSDGRAAATEWRLTEALDGASLLDVHILTGRTHQIRVHMLSIGHPVLGDVIYAPGIRMKVKIPRLMLHAHTLALTHPTTGKRMTFEAPIPQAFAETVEKLRLPRQLRNG